MTSGMVSRKPYIEVRPGKPTNLRIPWISVGISHIWWKEQFEAFAAYDGRFLRSAPMSKLDALKAIPTQIDELVRTSPFIGHFWNVQVASTGWPMTSQEFFDIYNHLLETGRLEELYDWGGDWMMARDPKGGSIQALKVGDRYARPRLPKGMIPVTYEHDQGELVRQLFPYLETRVEPINRVFWKVTSANGSYWQHYGPVTGPFGLIVQLLDDDDRYHGVDLDTGLSTELGITGTLETFFFKNHFTPTSIQDSMEHLPVTHVFLAPSGGTQELPRILYWLVDRLFLENPALEYVGFCNTVISNNQGKYPKRTVQVFRSFSRRDWKGIEPYGPVETLHLCRHIVEAILENLPNEENRTGERFERWMGEYAGTQYGFDLFGNKDDGVAVGVIWHPGERPRFEIQPWSRSHIRALRFRNAIRRALAKAVTASQFDELVGMRFPIPRWMERLANWLDALTSKK